MHIGQRIKEIFDAQPRNHNIEWFADRLHCKRANIYNIFNRSTIDTDLLMHISKVLDHDFFRDLSADFSKTQNGGDPARQELYDNLMTSIGRLLRDTLP